MVDSGDRLNRAERRNPHFDARSGCFGLEDGEVVTYGRSPISAVRVTGVDAFQHGGDLLGGQDRVAAAHERQASTVRPRMAGNVACQRSRISETGTVN